VAALITLAIHDLQKIPLITQSLSPGPIGFLLIACSDRGKT
jgi:hypothetical protein